MLISAVSVLLVLSSRIPLKTVGKSLKPLLLFLLIMFPVISLTSGGEVIYSYGLIRFYKGGLITASVISVRALSIILVTIVLFGSTGLNVIMKALEFFRIPSEISAIFLFTYRYIFLYFENINRLFTAAKLRGYSLLHGMRHLRNTVTILVTLLIRSYEQSERVYYAMRLRGFTGSFRTISSFSTVWSDALKTGIFVMIFLTILGIELL
jgi:cobalt/nickel transport system permease protein